MDASKIRLLRRAGVVAPAAFALLLFALLAAPGWGAGVSAPPTLGVPLQAMADTDDRSGFAGSETCQSCHPDTYAEWSASRHSRMVQAIKPSEVKASFSAGESLEYRGRTFTFERLGLRYFIVETPDGQPSMRHEIAYTLGNRRIQHYLTRRQDGALVLLPPSWDVVAGEWFPQEEIVPTGDSGIEPVQVWNKNCFGCHVSQGRKNFDTEALTYSSDWLDTGTNCETCHGPGREHSEYFLAGDRGEERPPIAGDAALKRPLMPFGGDASAELCAACHQNRYLLKTGFEPGDPFYDHFLTALLYTVPADAPDPGYWADGRTRRFSNNSFALWSSSCYLQGQVRCLDCHRSAHAINIDDNPQLAPEVSGKTLCNRCHSGIVATVQEHSKHPADSPGAACIACHMPRTVSGIKAQMRDHTLAVPVPENTRDYGIPNACNLCHEQEGPAWAADKIQAWYGDLDKRPAAMKLRRRAAAFSAARVGDESGLGPLLAILRDQDEPFLMRASAAGYLRTYPDARAVAGLWDALVDPHPLVRAVAPLSIAAHPEGRTLVNDLITMLTDPSYAVRINTAFALATLGVSVEGPLGEHLDRAQREYLEHLSLYPDSAEDQANRGTVLAMRGAIDEALVAYRIALRLDPTRENARYGLAIALLRTGSVEEGIRELETLRQQAPDYPGLEALLERLAGRGGR